jgi:hypothetical protein
MQLSCSADDNVLTNLSNAGDELTVVNGRK